MLKRSSKTKLIKSAKTHGVENEIGASIDDCARSTFQKDEVNVSSGESMSRCEANWTTSDDDCSEALSRHVLVVLVLGMASK